MNKRKCPCCGLTKVGPIRVWRTHTMYHNELDNYTLCCYYCILRNDYGRHFDWQEYYSSQYGCYDYSPYENDRSWKDYTKCLKTVRLVKSAYRDHISTGVSYR